MQTNFFQTVREDLDSRAAGPQCVRKVSIDPMRMTGMSRAFAALSSTLPGDALPAIFVGRKPYFTTDGGKSVKGGNSLG
jgi:hypothetical protein